jgi:hypothetical protein
MPLLCAAQCRLRKLYNETMVQFLGIRILTPACGRNAAPRHRTR